MSFVAACNAVEYRLIPQVPRLVNNFRNAQVNFKRLLGKGHFEIVLEGIALLTVHIIQQNLDVSAQRNEDIIM